MHGMVFIDIRDRFGITQAIVPNGPSTRVLYETAQSLGREYVVLVAGKVVERSNKNPDRATGDIEIAIDRVEILSESRTPPFLIETKTDGLEDIRMKYRFLDIRRDPVKDALILRHKTAQLTRNFLSNCGFIEIETPVLMKSTPEGARDFVVPSRMNPGQFYALPQSPQTFKQILMVAGMDRYFQIVKCFRDEELRADRQPEFTQIDVEMSFVGQEDVIAVMESLVRTVFHEIKGIDLEAFPRMTYDQAMTEYGIDKPDIRYGMKLVDITDLVKNSGFQVFNQAEIVLGIVCSGLAAWSNKNIKNLDKLAKSQAIGGNGMVWVKIVSIEARQYESSASKFYTADDFEVWAQRCNAHSGDLLCIMAGDLKKTREAMGKFRHEMGDQLGLRKEGYAALWVVDFPLLEYDDEEKRWQAMHHPFTSPKREDFHLLDSDPGKVRANAYDMVINGWEIGGGSIRIFQRDLQLKMFELLGFSEQEADKQFGFLMGAFQYGAPPHGGLAFGLDRLCSILGNESTIRNYIAFPKNKMGRDLMIDAPSEITEKQLKELSIKVDVAEVKQE